MAHYRIRVLLMEDDPGDQLMFERHLVSSRLARVNVVHAFSHAEGLLALERQRFDVVLLDLHLPDIDAERSVSQLAVRQPRCPIVVVSGDEDEDVALRAVREGAQDYLSKHDVAEGRINLVQKLIHAVDRHRLVSELALARDEATSASASKSAFLAVMSHEIRTPINGIMGLCQLLLADTDLNPQHREGVGGVLSSAEQLLRIINDILDFSKMEANRLELCAQPFQIQPFLHRQVKPFLAQLRGSVVDFRLEIDPAIREDTLWVADPDRLGQVLTNLLANAVKFTDKGQIVVRCRRHASSETTGAAQLRLEIEDSGLGISAEVQSKLFLPFSQGETSTARKHGGTGLGLAICKRLIEMMGGRIGLHSECGVGSLFWFEIPETTVTAVSEPEVTMLRPAELSWQLATLPRVGPGRVLVVEDNVINQEVARRFLSKLGLAVELACSGPEALACIDAVAIDLVLMDCQLPEMDGYETTARIRAHHDPRIRELPIIALTAQAMPGDRQRCLDAGMNDYVAKPVRLRTLGEVLQRWLGVEQDKARRIISRERALDPSRLSELRSLDAPGQESLFVRLADSLLAAFPERLIQVEKHLEAGDLEGLKRIAHQLVGNTGSLAALRLAELLRELEQMEHDEFPHKPRRIIGEIRAEFSRVRHELLVEIGRAS